MAHRRYRPWWQIALILGVLALSVWIDYEVIRVMWLVLHGAWS